MHIQPWQAEHYNGQSLCQFAQQWRKFLPTFQNICIKFVIKKHVGCEVSLTLNQWSFKSNEFIVEFKWTLICQIKEGVNKKNIQNSKVSRNLFKHSLSFIFHFVFLDIFLAHF